MEMRSKFFAIIMASALACAGGMLAACSSAPSTEDLIREGVANELEPLKAHDQATIDEMMSDITASQDLSAYGIDNTEYMNLLLDDFDYSIDSVTADEASATATVTLTVKSLTEAMDIAQGLSEDFINGGKGANMSDEELNAEVGKMLIQGLTQAQSRPVTVEIGYILMGDTWTPDFEAQNAIYQAFFD